MGAFTQLAKTFRHGIHPLGHKEYTEQLPIQRMPFCARYTLPLNQHLGAPSSPVVEVGQTLTRGQLIAEPAGFMSTALHSPVAGKVLAIAPRRHPNGQMLESIEIEADPFNDQVFCAESFNVEQNIDFSTLAIEDFIAQVQQAGIVGLGGAAFPSHVKFSLPKGKQIDHILVNGAECEPFLTNDYRLMIEQSERLLKGAEIARQVLGARSIVIGIELNKSQAIKTLKSCADSKTTRIVPLHVKYPQGAEKMLINAALGLTVPNNKLPRDVGVLVNNVGTLVALAQYFDQGMPLIERIVTVSGPGVERPANLIVPIGTPIRELLRFCGGLKQSTQEVVMGGPMMGSAIADLDAPILKGSSGILAFTEKESRTPREYPCIRCGRCLEVCPYFLNPSRLIRLAGTRNYQGLQQLHIMDCVECGSCTFTCPSGIPIAQRIKAAKSEIRHREKLNKP